MDGEDRLTKLIKLIRSKKIEKETKTVLHTAPAQPQSSIKYSLHFLGKECKIENQGKWQAYKNTL